MTVESMLGELRPTRQRRGLTLAQVSVELGLAVSLLSRWERGLQAPRGRDRVRALADWLGVEAPEASLDTKVCANCGETIVRRTSTRTDAAWAAQRSCSHRCAVELRVNERTPEPYFDPTHGRWMIRPVGGPPMLLARHTMERCLGRALRQGEVVHHRDEDKANDRPSNLRLFASQADHARHHAKGRRFGCD